MGAALVLLLVGLGAMAAGVLIGRYYVPDDRQLRRTARHSRAYMRALSHLIARDHDTVVSELRGVVEENVDDVEPYFALGAMFRSRGETERAIRVHQALALRERDRRKLRQRAMYELGLDFRAAGMPRRATRAMEEVLLEEPAHEGALRVLAALYEEQARFNEAAALWQRIGKRRNEDTSSREHHLLVAAAQAALAREDLDSARQLLKASQRHDETAHFYAAAAELAAARGNHRAAKERLKQALIADAALAPHLLPGLIAAEEGLAATEKERPFRDLDDLDSGPHKGTPPPEDSPILASRGPASDRSSSGPVKQLEAGAGETALATVEPAKLEPTDGVPLVPSAKPAGSIAERVLAVLAEIEAKTGPRLELALIRAQLASDREAQLPIDSAPPSAAPAELGLAIDSAPPSAVLRAPAELGLAIAKELVAQFPEALAARVATARLALASGDAAAIRAGLEVFVAEQGALAWALRGRWQCQQCGHRPGPFSWRCGNCRRWNTLRMETGVEPQPILSRERRAAPRPARPEGLLGAAPDESLPAATLDPGLSEDELARAGVRRSLLGRVGGWFSNVWRRDR